MGIRLRNAGAQRLKIKFDRLATEGSKAAREAHREVAEEVAHIAQQMAPFKEGDLEGSIEVRRRRETTGISTLEVSTQGIAYATEMHEGDYELGAGSVAKDSGSPYRVGRKFLSRALGYVRRDRRSTNIFIDKIRSALRRAV